MDNRDAGPERTQGEVLVVDLDGTLLRSDMLDESLMALAQTDWRALPKSLGALRDGRAALKSALADRAVIDPVGLPYDPRVIAEIEAWRAGGGRTALVTATDQRLAKAIAAHLGLFDEVHGSDASRNLKGTEKALFLQERYGGVGYTYMGDSAADLEVWPGARQAISVGASTATRRALDGLGIPARHITGAPDSTRRAWIRQMRPHQWLKNLLVFLPVLADHAFDPASILAACLAFAALSAMASAGYVMNDLLDLADDRSHPRKRDRPIASGALTIRHAVALCGGLIVLGIVLSALVSAALVAVCVGYLALTMAYSIWLKRLRLVDICMLATLYTVRIGAGTLAILAPPSVWMFAFSLFLFFSLAAVKRLGELSGEDTKDRAGSRRGYTLSDRSVIQQMAISSGYVAVLVLALYVDEARVQVNFAEPWLLWGVCPLLLAWLSRMVMVAGRGEMDDDPIVHTLKDWKSRSVIVLMGVLVLGAVAL